jgi:class 3 adenylate cyclase
MFADIAGFTAWSSVREPAGLYAPRNLYGAFDAIARKRGVFKVETIGDSYVAWWVFQARKDHAVVMAGFARLSRRNGGRLTELEATLGPTPEISSYALVCTADLSLQVFTW